MSEGSDFEVGCGWAWAQDQGDDTPDEFESCDWCRNMSEPLPRKMHGRLTDSPTLSSTDSTRAEDQPPGQRVRSAVPWSTPAAVMQSMCGTSAVVGPDAGLCAAGGSSASCVASGLSSATAPTLYSTVTKPIEENLCSDLLGQSAVTSKDLLRFCEQLIPRLSDRLPNADGTGPGVGAWTGGQSNGVVSRKTANQRNELHKEWQQGEPTAPVPATTFLSNLNVAAQPFDYFAPLSAVAAGPSRGLANGMLLMSSGATEPSGTASKVNVPTLPEGSPLLDPVQWGPEVTTVMIRRIPRLYTQLMLISEAAARGFDSLWDFLYLPFEVKKGANVGYGFINFIEFGHAQRFREAFDGTFLDNTMREKGKPIRVHPASVQGYEANFAHFQNTKTGQKQDPCFSPIFLGPGGIPQAALVARGAEMTKEMLEQILLDGGSGSRQGPCASTISCSSSRTRRLSSSLDPRGGSSSSSSSISNSSSSKCRCRCNNRHSKCRREMLA